MMADSYPYRLAAVYPDEPAADAALDAVIAEMAGDIRAVELPPDAGNVDGAIEPEAVCGDRWAGDASTPAASIASELYVSATVVAPLIVLGYGSVFGNTSGAIRGLRLRARVFTDLVKDALKADFHVVILHAANAGARRQAATVLDGTLPGH